MAKKQATPKELTYKVIFEKQIHVQGKPRQPEEVFTATELPEHMELSNLVKHKYLEIL